MRLNGWDWTVLALYGRLAGVLLGWDRVTAVLVGGGEAQTT